MPLFSAPLWRHPDFMRLWTAQAVSQFGEQVTRAALSLAALLTVHAEPAQLGVLAALSSAPAVIVGMFAGGYVDRARRRALMISADIVRGLLLLTVPIAAWLGIFSMMQVYVLAFLVGAASVLFDLADTAYLPTLLPQEHLIEGNSKLGVTRATAEVGGSALAGLLVQIIGAPMTITFNAFTYLFSAFALGRIKAPEPATATETGDEHPLAGIGAGLRAVLANPLVRPIFVIAVSGNMFGAFFAALYTFFVVSVLHLTPFMLGLSIAAGGIGSLVGAALSPLIARALGVGPAILTCWVVMPVLMLATPLAQGPPYVALSILIAGQFLGDALAVAGNTIAFTLYQTTMANSRLGRAQAAFRVGAGAGMIVGALAGGVLGEILGARATLFIAIGGMALSAAPGFVSPLRRLKSMPAPTA